MPYTVRGAFVIGLLLPVLETYRRGMAHWRVESTTMLEDYLAGALLLVAASAALSHRVWARDLLLVAWAWLTGMMTISLVDHIEITLREGSQEPDNAIVIAPHRAPAPPAGLDAFRPPVAGHVPHLALVSKPRRQATR